MSDMPLPQMTPERLEAGRRYLTSLRGLGLRPNMALWVLDKAEQEFRLLIFSEVVELKGALPIYELLNSAYYHAQTPADFDPWIVELADTKSPIYNELRETRRMQVSVRLLNQAENGELVDVPGGIDLDNSFAETFGMQFKGNWVLIEPTASSLPNPRQQWKRLKENVRDVAA